MEGQTMRYGVCAGPESAPVLARAGFEFIELNVQGHLRPEQAEKEFLPQLDLIRASALRCFSF